MLEQHLLNFILDMKHDNVMMYDTFMWSNFALCDNAMNNAFANEIQRLMLEERVDLGT